MSKDKEDAIEKVEPSTYPALCNPHVPELIESVVETMGITPWQLAQVRLPTGGGLAWTIVTDEGPKVVEEFDAMIGLVKAKQRAWYRIPFEESGGGSPPDCTSCDGLSGFGVNNPDAPPDQLSEAHACASCEWNVFGSKRGAGKGKDCIEVMHLYLWLEGEALPAVLQVPPTSLQAVQSYLLKLTSKMKAPGSVMTHFALTVRHGRGVPDSSMLQLTTARELSAEEQQYMTDITKKMGDLVPTLYPAVAPGGSV